MLAADSELVVVLFDFFDQGSVFFRVLPSRSKFIWRLRNATFKAFSDHTFDWTCERCEEVGYGLAIRAVEAHFGEEGFCIRCLAKVDLSTFIKDGDFVKHLIGRLRCLVDGDTAGDILYLSRHLERLTEFDRVSRVKTSVIARDKPTQYGIEKMKTDLVLLSQHWRGAPERAASEMVTRFRSPPETPRTKSFPTRVLIVCEIPKAVFQSEHGSREQVIGGLTSHDHISHEFCVGLLRDPGRQVLLLTSTSSEIESLADSHLSPIQLRIDSIKAELPEGSERRLLQPKLLLP